MTMLESRWNSLQPSPETDVFQLYDPTHPLDFYIGRDTRGQRLLLLVSAEQPPASKDFKAIQFLTFQRTDGKWSMLFRLSVPSLVPSLRNHVRRHNRIYMPIATPDRPVANVMKRFANWQRLMERGHTGLLEDFSFRGLCGELIFLERFALPNLGSLEAIQSWGGPNGADQDFQAADRAWEIKTSRPTRELCGSRLKINFFPPVGASS